MRRRVLPAVVRAALQVVADNPEVVSQYGPAVARGAARAAGGVAALAVGTASSLVEQHREASRALSRRRAETALQAQTLTSVRRRSRMARLTPVDPVAPYRRRRATYKRRKKLNAILAGVENHISEIDEAEKYSVRVGTAGLENHVGTVSFYMGDAPPAGGGSSFLPPLNAHALQGMKFPQGDTILDRTGRYIYYRHTTLRFRLTIVNQGATGALRNLPRDGYTVRMIVWKVNKRATTNEISNRDFGQTAFLDIMGEPFGVSNMGNLAAPRRAFSANQLSVSKFDSAMPNKKDFHFVKDIKFKMANPAESQVDSLHPTNMTPAQMKYPSVKEISLKLPWNRKVRFPDAGADTPEDFDYRYCATFYIYTDDTSPAGQGTTFGDPAALVVTAYGVTSAYDN